MSGSATGVGPLEGVRVLDLSSLVPGPLATLVLADAGADVVKIERPDVGDEMRSYEPKLGDTSANYALLNRAKRAFATDLKDRGDRERVLDLAAHADVVVEQFRPGVARRLGVGYEAVAAVNPRVVYCSITGYGQRAPQAGHAGHDLNYLAESGLLGVVADAHGQPPLPPTVIADIAGGTYPAVVNILLALRLRERTGRGCHLDISMTHNLQVLAYGYFATHQAGGGWPRPGAELLTGGSPRYRVYAASDGRHVAVAALEQRFWERFAALIGLAADLVDDRGREAAVADEVARLIGGRSSDHWRDVFSGEDVCACVVATHPEAVEAGLVRTESPHRLVGDGFDVGALDTPVADGLRLAASRAPAPTLEPLTEAGTGGWPVGRGGGR